jgi:hypothetical protein
MASTIKKDRKENKKESAIGRKEKKITMKNATVRKTKSKQVSKMLKKIGAPKGVINREKAKY